jgi:hypothetical protein
MDIKYIHVMKILETSSYPTIKIPWVCLLVL